MMVVLSTGIFDDIDTNVHVERLRALIAREVPGWVMRDSGYGKTKNQMRMR